MIDDDMTVEFLAPLMHLVMCNAAEYKASSFIFTGNTNADLAI